MKKLSFLLLFALATCQCYDLYNEDYENDRTIDRILDSYRQDPNEELESYKKTEEFDVTNEVTRETISMPGVSPQKVTTQKIIFC